MGSANFTSRGLGISSSPNLEANILYLVNRAGNPRAAAALERSCPEGPCIDRFQDIRWEPGLDDSQDDVDPESFSLPSAFGAAVFLSKDGQNSVELEIADQPPDGWQVLWTFDEEHTILDEHVWKQKEAPKRIMLDWPYDMAPSGFEVTWHDCKGRAWWPVNVDRAGSLPPPDELKDLPLDLLINVLTSARPLHQVLKTWIMKKGLKGNSIKVKEIIDPHKRVDTSAFLLQKTYRVSAALSGLRSRLERPVMSVDAMEWRLRGPIGVTAVQNAILKEARSTDEQVFLLTELALELSRTKPQTAPGCLSLEVINGQIQGVMADLKAQTMEKLENSPQALKDYVRSALSEVIS